jgi:hypothetical protein
LQAGDVQHKYLLPVYQLTYDLGYAFTNIDGTRWNVPDQMEAYSNPKLMSIANSAFVESYQQWIVEKSSSFNFGIGVQTTCTNVSFCMGLNFNYSKESYEYENNLKFNTKQASFSEMQWTHYTLQSLDPPFLMTLYSGLAGYINSLPAKIATPADQALYSRLVQYWGTHVAMSVDMGAYAHVSSFASSSYVQDVTEQWAANQWGLNFDAELFNLLNITGHAGGFHNKSSIHVNQSFIDNTNSSNFYRGGNLSMANSSQTDWLASTIETPNWVTTTLTSLSDIVPLDKASIANNVEATIKAYIATGKLPTSPVETLQFHEPTYPREVSYYAANWPRYFMQGNAMPYEHTQALIEAGRA